jgi:hypothetical protein
LEQKAELIADRMTNNANFESPEPAISVLQAATTAFDTAIIKPKRAARQKS